MGFCAKARSMCSSVGGSAFTCFGSWLYDMLWSPMSTSSMDSASMIEPPIMSNRGSWVLADLSLVSSASILATASSSPAA